MKLVKIKRVGSTEVLNLKSMWQRAGSATYMPHSHQKHTYKSNIHKNRSNIKTKYNDNKKQRSVFGVYAEVGITQRIFERQ